MTKGVLPAACVVTPPRSRGVRSCHRKQRPLVTCVWRPTCRSTHGRPPRPAPRFVRFLAQRSPRAPFLRIVWLCVLSIGTVVFLHGSQAVFGFAIVAVNFLVAKLLRGSKLLPAFVSAPVVVVARRRPAALSPLLTLPLSLS